LRVIYLKVIEVSMPFDLPNTASTLSPFFSPGEDLRYFPTTEGSISTVGDYRITTNFDSDSISEVPRSLSFVWI